MTLGEKRVRTKFNPSDNSKVQHIKERIAEVMNYINDNIKTISVGEYVTNEEIAEMNGEQKRLIALALTKLEEAAMFAVKAATV